jgi:hypothetical protein
MSINKDKFGCILDQRQVIGEMMAEIYMGGAAAVFKLQAAGFYWQRKEWSSVLRLLDDASSNVFYMLTIFEADFL